MPAAKTIAVYSTCESAIDLKELAQFLVGEHGSPSYSEDRVVEHLHFCFTNDAQPRPVYLVNRNFARITTRESRELAKYSGISSIEYMRTCFLIARTQLGALSKNALLEPEDLQCPRRHCLFHWHHELHESAFSFESRQVCPGCREFYAALGAETELLDLLDCLGPVPIGD